MLKLLEKELIQKNILRHFLKENPVFFIGNYTYLLQDDNGQILDAHSISAGLDYPGIGPEHSWLKETGRVKYYSSTSDSEALNAFKICCNLEGII